MSKEEIKKSLEKTFIDYVCMINNTLDNEQDKTIRFKFLINYMRYMEKQFNLELEI